MSTFEYEKLKENLTLGETQSVSLDDKDYDKKVAQGIHGEIEFQLKMGRITPSQMEELVAMIPKYVRNSKERDRKLSEKVDKKMKDEKRKEEIQAGVRVPEFVSDPKDLEDRRARANYWRGQTKWKMLVETITLKNRKFNKLWKEYNKTDDIRKQEEIVNEMEKMFPTTQRKIDTENKKLAGK